MDRLLKYQKKYIGLHAIILGILLIYSIIEIEKLLNDGSGMLISIALLFVTFFGSIIIINIDSLQTRMNFIIIKFVYLVLLAFLLFSGNLFIFGVTFIMYSLVGIELLILNLYESGEDNKIMVRLIMIPVMFSVIYGFIYQTVALYMVFGTLIYYIAFYVTYNLLLENRDDLKEEVLSQQKLWEESQKANEALKKTQLKAKKVYNKMVNQKYELEKTNKSLNRVSAEMYILNELLKYISSTLEINELLDLVIDSIIGAIGVDTCYVIIKSDESEDYYCRAKSNYNIDVKKDLLNSFHNGELQKYFDSKQSFSDEFVELNEYSFIKDRPAGSLIITPLIRNEEVYGLLFAEHASAGVLTEHNLQFFEGIGTQINIAVNNASLYTKMHELAIRDGLTNLYNRGHFQSELYDFFDKANEEHFPLSVVLFDLDKFKNVNDTYGHLFGDKALKMVSRIAQQYAVENDGFAGRYGGEEFVMAFPHKEMEETFCIIEKMHKAIKNESLIYDNNKIVNINTSVGITSYPKFGVSGEDLLNRADNAMYFSKTHGRGKITLDSKNYDVENF